MDNLKEALEYVVDLSVPQTYQIDGETYSSEKLFRIDEKEELLVNALNVSTLTGFIDYIKENRDGIDFMQTMIVVEDTKSVSLISTPNKDKKRETFIYAQAIIPDIAWGRWMDIENFIIGMQSKFDASAHKDMLMRYIGNMQEEQGVQTVDDGVSQRIVAKTGVANVENVILPNPVQLRPFRSFQEIEQVQSDFIFRVRQGGECALFEADGGEWRIRCRQAIKNYLEEQLKEMKNIVIIG